MAIRDAEGRFFYKLQAGERAKEYEAVVSARARSRLRSRLQRAGVIPRPRA